jgi:polyhydroxyalkanoate synthesis regulator phasin
MLDFIRKTYLFGLGLTTATREKIEEIVDELVRRGEVAEKDRPHVLEDLLKRAREEQHKLSASVKETVRSAIGELGIPSRRAFDELARRVEELERQSHAHGGRAKSDDDSTAPDA